MTKQEFEVRVGIKVGMNEFDAINVVYNNSDLFKDEFCKMWIKMNHKRIAAYQQKEKEEREYNDLKLEAARIYSNKKVFYNCYRTLSWNIFDEDERFTLNQLGMHVRDTELVWETLDRIHSLIA